MPPSQRSLDAEARFRALCVENDIPEPDEVEHRPGEVLLLYHEQKLAVVVELEDLPPPGGVSPREAPPPGGPAARGADPTHRRPRPSTPSPPQGGRG